VIVEMVRPNSLAWASPSGESVVPSLTVNALEDAMEADKPSEPGIPRMTVSQRIRNVASPADASINNAVGKRIIQPTRPLSDRNLTTFVTFFSESSEEEDGGSWMVETLW
jgi:hypothetical protein